VICICDIIFRCLESACKPSSSSVLTASNHHVVWVLKQIVGSQQCVFRFAVLLPLNVLVQSMADMIFTVEVKDCMVMMKLQGLMLLWHCC
jgi:hypothetical protein